MKVYLNYAPLKLSGDIPCYEYESREKLQEHFQRMYEKNSAIHEQSDRVYLLSINNEVYVTEHKETLYKIAYMECAKLDVSPGENPGIYEMDSFESAYEMAMDLQEISHLCYKPSQRNQL